MEVGRKNINLRMKISELIALLQKQQELYGDFEIMVRDHQTGKMNTVDYVTYLTQDKRVLFGNKPKLQINRTFR